ncbi:MAG: DUF2145 domain-containing protein [Azonexus sp.]|jgi:hypothetical protein|uniref:DUF2145 domain-containing protein n=1 Tax=Azonexus sp. TaxID=1872668 RepID=UPI0028191A66|nr:DUF2145 domain-containing protein [Azonexus sp.]MDR0775386.1 DUF2145 domain-containing protein [Azonexus sp.]
MKMRHYVAVALLAAGLLPGTPAQAGRACEDKPLTAQMVERSMELAAKTWTALESQYQQDGTQVVILARMGQDLSQYKQRYSHVGMVYRSVDDTGAPVWRVLHKLNQCGTSEAGVYRQGLGEFTLDDLWRYEVAWVVPTPAVQARLLALIGDPSKSLKMHAKPYNMLSYPWATRYQQSNQWVLESIAEAMDADVANREQAQAWLKLKGYQPAVLEIGALTRLGARMTKANIAFDDHPNEKRYSDRIETITADSLFAWLKRAGMAGAPVTLRLDK